VSEHVTVEAVKDARDWQSDDGKIRLTFYTLDVKRESGMTQEVDHSRKQGGAEPQPGEELEVIFEEGKYRPKMKKAPQGSFAGGSTERSTGGKREWKPESQYDPEKTARIGRAHAQEMALRWATLLHQTDRGLDAETLPKLFQIADAFERDVNQAGQAANSAQGAPPSKDGALLAGSASPGSSSSPAEIGELAELAKALDTAGLVFAPARDKVAEYMLTMPEAEQIRAVNQLTNAADLETQAMTLRAMRQRAESKFGGPLPVDPAEDDIPF
jgi:hypothetical protein